MRRRGSGGRRMEDCSSIQPRARERRGRRTCDRPSAGASFPRRRCRRRSLCPAFRERRGPCSPRLCHEHRLDQRRARDRASSATRGPSRASRARARGAGARLDLPGRADRPGDRPRSSSARSSATPCSRRTGATDATERDRLHAQARVIGENVGQQLDGINRALASVRDDYIAMPPHQTSTLLSARLKVLSDAIPGVRSMVVLDADGHGRGDPASTPCSAATSPTATTSARPRPRKARRRCTSPRRTRPRSTTTRSSSGGRSSPRTAPSSAPPSPPSSPSTSRC